MKEEGRLYQDRVFVVSKLKHLKIEQLVVCQDNKTRTDYCLYKSMG